MSIAATLPWLVPGSVLSLGLSLLASGALGRWLRVRRSMAWVLLFALGIILSSTLSPLDRGAVIPPSDPRTCDLSRTWPASLADLRRGDDVAVNILLFIPLGLAIGIAPASRRKVITLVAAMALPLVIEAVQLRVIELDRACQGADVVDNLTGLALGVVGGILLGRLAPSLGRPSDGQSPGDASLAGAGRSG